MNRPKIFFAKASKFEQFRHRLQRQACWDRRDSNAHSLRFQCDRAKSEQVFLSYGARYIQRYL